MSSGTNRYRNWEKHPFKGYTLIEVLVAIAIFSAMMMLGGIALNQGLTQYHALAEKGIGFWDYARKIWIDKSFNSTIDYYVYKRGEGWFPYFKGNQEGVSYVSLAPFAGDLPVVTWIRNEAESNGMRSLVYYELPVYTKSYEDIERNYIFGDYRKGRSLKLLEGVESIEFSFYGYDNLERKFRWYGDFDGQKMRFLPSSIVISYQQDGRKSKLVFGINVNSPSKTVYNDFYLRQ